MLPPGSEAPVFRLKDLDGHERSLDAMLSERPAVLVFFKIACPTCQMTMPFVQRIADGDPTAAASLVPISQDDEKSTRRFLKEFGVKLPTLLDEKGTYPASNAFRIEHVPTFFVVTQDGKVEHSFTGFVKSEIEALGKRFGVQPFRAGEKVPALKPG